MDRVDLIEEIFILRYLTGILLLICVILYSKLKDSIRESDILTHQFYALKNKFQEFIKEK